MQSPTQDKVAIPEGVRVLPPLREENTLVVLLPSKRGKHRVRSGLY